MQTNRFKVARHLSDWWDEFRMYHRKDGIIVKERDDLMSATRYACMMLRFAETARRKADGQDQNKNGSYRASPGIIGRFGLSSPGSG
jgi:hypothetical protein